MRFISLLLFLSLSSTLCAQEVLDIVKLKDGTIYKGNVTEYKPEKEVTIMLLDDRIVTIGDASIESIEIEGEQVIKKHVDLKEKGYFNNTFLGFQFGRNDNRNVQAFFMLNTVNGYKSKNHHIGFGLGLENHAGNWYSPVYLDYSYQVFSPDMKPMIGINGGFMVPLRDNLGSRFGYTGGGFIGGRIGLMDYNTERFGFLLNFTYRYVFLRGAEYTDFTENGETYQVTGSADLHRVGLTFGFIFN